VCFERYRFYTYWILWLNPTGFSQHRRRNEFYTYWILWLNPTELAAPAKIICFIPTGFYG